MPELPEVETVRRGLERTLVGRRFDEVTVGRERVARRTLKDFETVSPEHEWFGLIGEKVPIARTRCRLDCSAPSYERSVVVDEGHGATAT